MKKIAATVMAALFAVFAVVMMFVAVQPDVLTVSRHIDVAASPADIAPYAMDLRKFTAWSPWRDIDPGLTQTWSDDSTGVGAWYHWTGNDEVGEGKQTIKVSEPGKVVHELHFVRPFEDVATSTIEWSGTEERSTITWSFEQEATFMTKAANLVMDIEGMLEGDYQRGLDDMKPLVEAAAEARKKREEEIRLRKLAVEEAAGKPVDEVAEVP